MTIKHSVQRRNNMKNGVLFIIIGISLLLLTGCFSSSKETDSTSPGDIPVDVPDSTPDSSEGVSPAEDVSVEEPEMESEKPVSEGITTDIEDLDTLDDDLDLSELDDLEKEFDDIDW